MTSQLPGMGATATPTGGQMLVKYGSLLFFLVLTALAARTGGTYMPGEWYANLAKPWWTPPGWVFGPAWAVLYLLIAIAGWLVWRAQGFGPLLALWAAQLVVNAAWSYIMFGAQSVGGALIDVTLLWLLVGAFTILAWTENPTAAYLFVPYWAWVTFAGALNFEVWRLN